MLGLGVEIKRRKVRLYYIVDSSEVNIAQSLDGLNFTKLKETRNQKVEEKNYHLVSDYKINGKKVAYFSGKEILVGLFKSTKKFDFLKTGITSQNEIFVDFATKTEQGIFLIYHTYEEITTHDPYTPKNIGAHFVIRAACLDSGNPEKVIWNTKNALWPEPEAWRGKETQCFGTVLFDGKLFSYWNVKDLGIFIINFPSFKENIAHEHHHYKITKHDNNPILIPNDGNEWENEATFNPAAFYYGNKVYLLYRALGHGYLSVIGLAESNDGINFTRPFNEPIYTAREPFEKKSPKATKHTLCKFMSGAGMAGCEDPKITLLGDRLYMIYVAFNGWEGGRLALTSIKLKDFIDKDFLWEKPVLISPPGVTDKSGCLLPEKINGKYVIFHRVFPNILIDFVDDLNFNGTNWLKGQFKISPRPTMWDSRKVGAGAPPIKTKDGWLLIYQAVTDCDDSKYKIGAMLLDLKDPTKVIARSSHPIIEPDQAYENDLAKFGVVYPCGAVVVKNKLLVYYGGSDAVTCVATADFDEFLSELKKGEEIKLTLP